MYIAFGCRHIAVLLNDIVATVTEGTDDKIIFYWPTIFYVKICQKVSESFVTKQVKHFLLSNR